MQKVRKTGEFAPAIQHFSLIYFEILSIISRFGARSFSSISNKKRKILLVFRIYKYTKRCAQSNFRTLMTLIQHQNDVS